MNREFSIAFLLATCVIAASANAEMIHLMSRKGDTEAVLALIESGTPVDLPSTSNTSNLGVTPLYVAAQFGRTETALALLDSGADPTLRPTVSTTNGTPVHMAARQGDIRIMRAFLDRGVDPEIYDRFLGTPLHQARLNGHAALESLLLDSGAQSDWEADPIDDRIVEGDIENGRSIAKGCAGLCHALQPGDAERTLWDVIGSPKTGGTGYDYSAALSEIGGIWTYQDLNSYLASPFRYAPGTRMYYAVEDPRERADLIAFLRTLSDDPLPLP